MVGHPGPVDTAAAGVAHHVSERVPAADDVAGLEHDQGRCDQAGATQHFGRPATVGPCIEQQGDDS